MKKSYFLAFLFLIVCSFTACKNDPTEDDGKNPVVPYLNIAVDTVYFSSSAAEGRIVDVDAIDNSWIADCQADWCKINTSKNSLGIKEIE